MIEIIFTKFFLIFLPLDGTLKIAFFKPKSCKSQMSIIIFLNRGDVNAYTNPLIFDFKLN